MRKTSGPPEVRAAGGIVWRRSASGPEFALIHRPAYDDWSFPKGKLLPAEDELEGALREVREETGLSCVAGSPAGRDRYRDRKGRVKEVAYWSMQPTDGRFAPSDEVDRLEWLPLAEAVKRLTYGRDRRLLRRLKPKGAA